MGLGRSRRDVAGPGAAVAQGRPHLLRRHGSAVVRLGSGLGMDRQPGHPRCRPLVDGPGDSRRPRHLGCAARAPHRGGPRGGPDRHPAARPPGGDRDRCVLPAPQGDAGTVDRARRHPAGLRPARPGGPALVSHLGHHPHGARRPRAVARVGTGPVDRGALHRSHRWRVAPQAVAGHQPLSMVLAVFVLWGIVMLPLGRWTTSWRLDRARLGSALPAAQGSVSPAFES